MRKAMQSTKRQARLSYRDRIRSAKGQPLTEREIEVMWRVADGLSNKLIGDHLDIAAQTVKFHVTNACAKLGASTRTQAAVKFVLSRVELAPHKLDRSTLPGGDQKCGQASCRTVT